MDNQKNLFIVLGAALALYLSGIGNAVAGTCVIRGQGLVSAYVLAEQEGFRSFGLGYRNKGSSTRWGKIYTVPGKLGVKGRATAVIRKAGASFFRPRRAAQHLRQGWKITDVRYAGSPTAVGHKILNGTYIYLYTRDKIPVARQYNFYITSFTLTHPQPSRKCGSDPISQQIVLRQAFKG